MNEQCSLELYEEKLPKNFYNNNLSFVEEKFDKYGEAFIDYSMKNRLGFLPTSIWKTDKNIVKYLKKEINDTCQTRKTKNSNRSDRRNGINNGKCSVFNPQLAQMILSAYATKNGTVYDAFAGGGTRGYISTKMGYKYTGVELRKEECDRVYEQMKNWNITFELINDDSTTYIPKEKYDFCFTCPPYYDLEVYSDLPNDLSNAKSYEEYLDMLKKVVSNCFKVLKNQTFCVFVVGNFRNEKGELLHLNGDLVKISKEIGFKLWDEIVFEGASSVALTRVGKFLKNRKSVRMHEYIIVLKKE